ncbi:hypothetical protein BB561_004239 [Smittium simulii]|uniref:RRM domain-containing protein n=1 Tax=Smittium simulii TaxID=133385 RepID=A0A2T9YHJ3_9FUNG|nr:hypothetical protein BB561_004239 [Smittium simulii]
MSIFNTRTIKILFDPKVFNNYTTVLGIVKHFEEYGSVDAINFMKNRATGERTGIANITFMDEHSAKQVLKKREHRIKDGLQLNNTVQIERMM